MKRIILLLCIACLALASCKNIDGESRNIRSAEQLTQTVQLLGNNELRFIELSGTPYERGMQHGKLLKQEIHEVIALFKADIKETTNEDPDKFISKFLELTDYKSSVKKWMPELMEENVCPLRCRA